MILLGLVFELGLRNLETHFYCFGISLIMFNSFQTEQKIFKENNTIYDNHPFLKKMEKKENFKE